MHNYIEHKDDHFNISKYMKVRTRAWPAVWMSLAPTQTRPCLLETFLRVGYPVLFFRHRERHVYLQSDVVLKGSHAKPRSQSSNYCCY